MHDIVIETLRKIKTIEDEVNKYELHVEKVTQAALKVTQDTIPGFYPAALIPHLIAKAIESSMPALYKDTRIKHFKLLESAAEKGEIKILSAQRVPQNKIELGSIISRGSAAEYLREFGVTLPDELQANNKNNAQKNECGMFHPEKLFEFYKDSNHDLIRAALFQQLPDVMSISDVAFLLACDGVEPFPNATKLAHYHVKLRKALEKSGGLKGIHVNMPEKFTADAIHRDEFKRYLKSIDQWKVKNYLLANWWPDDLPASDTESQADFVANAYTLKPEIISECAVGISILPPTLTIEDKAQLKDLNGMLSIKNIATLRYSGNERLIEAYSFKIAEFCLYGAIDYYNPDYANDWRLTDMTPDEWRFKLNNDSKTLNWYKFAFANDGRILISISEFKKLLIKMCDFPLPPDCLLNNWLELEIEEFKADVTTKNQANAADKPIAPSNTNESENIQSADNINYTLSFSAKLGNKYIAPGCVVDNVNILKEPLTKNDFYKYLLKNGFYTYKTHLSESQRIKPELVALCVTMCEYKAFEGFEPNCNDSFEEMIATNPVLRKTHRQYLPHGYLESAEVNSLEFFLINNDLSDMGLVRYLDNDYSIDTLIDWLKSQGLDIPVTLLEFSATVKSWQKPQIEAEVIDNTGSKKTKRKHGDKDKERIVHAKEWIEKNDYKGGKTDTQIIDMLQKERPELWGQKDTMTTWKKWIQLPEAKALFPNPRR